MQLNRHQRKAVDFLLTPEPRIKSNAKILAYAAGTGKTPITCQYIKEAGFKSALIITVAAPEVKEHWKQHLVTWSGVDPNDIHIVENSFDYITKKPFIIVNYELMITSLVLKQLQKRAFELGVVDEVHRLCNHNSKSSQAVLSRKMGPPLAGNWKHKIGLSGTLMPNRPIELWPITRVWAPEVLKPFESFDAFGQKFCNGHLDGNGTWNYKGASNLDELRERLKPFVLSYDFADKPPVYPTTVYVDIGKIGFDETNTMTATLQKEVGKAKVPHILPFLQDKFINEPTHYLLFAYHSEVIDLLRAGLTKCELGVIDGRVSKHQRSQVLKQFCKPVSEQYGRKAKVLLAQIGSIGTAFDGLQKYCNEAILIEPDWSEGKFRQALGRLVRHGQIKDKVHLTEFIAENTIDEPKSYVRQYKGHNMDTLFNSEEEMLEEILGKLVDAINANTEALLSKSQAAPATPSAKGQAKESSTTQAASGGNGGKKGKGKVKEEEPAEDEDETEDDSAPEHSMTDLQALARTFINKDDDEKEKAKRKKAISKIVSAHGAELLKELNPKEFDAVYDKLKALVGDDDDV